MPGVIRELYGGAEDFRVRDRRLTHATTVENTPSANADMSSVKGGEKPPRRKRKVFYATFIGVE